jgi:hypothetical protein
MLYREIIAVCSQILTKHINILCGQNTGPFMFNLVVHSLSLKFSFPESPDKSLSYTFNHSEDNLFFTPKGCLLLFSRAEQSFSSCHSHNCYQQWQNAVTSAQFALDGLSLTNRFLHILLLGPFRHRKLFRGFTQSPSPLSLRSLF